MTFTATQRALVILLSIAAILTTAYGILVMAMVATPDCHTEDSAQAVCMWHAERQGNGTGHSFIKLGDQIVYFGS